MIQAFVNGSANNNQNCDFSSDWPSPSPTPGGGGAPSMTYHPTWISDYPTAHYYTSDNDVHYDPDNDTFYYDETKMSDLEKAVFFVLFCGIFLLLLYIFMKK